MSWWQIVLVGSLIGMAVLALAAYLLWRNASERNREFGERLGELPWRLRLKLAWRLMTDDRVPLALRAIPPALVLYLAMPLDIVPDFIPVLGQLDDILVIIVAVGLLTRFVPMAVVDEHLLALEAQAGRDEEG